MRLLRFLCVVGRAFNWPTVPDIREDPDNERLFDCVLVIVTTCQATLRKSYLWEKK
jgi:hypothetical protein